MYTTFTGLLGVQLLAWFSVREAALVPGFRAVHGRVAAACVAVLVLAEVASAWFGGTAPTAAVAVVLPSAAFLMLNNVAPPRRGLLRLEWGAVR